MAERPTVPKFGTWDKDDVGYTVYFDKVRENKGATAPPLRHRPYNPDDPEEGPLRAVPPPSTAGERPSGHTHGQRRAGSSSSEPGCRGVEQSKFAPPPQYHPRPSPQAPQHQHHGGGHRHHPSPTGHGGGGHRGPQAPRQHHRHAAAAAPRARSASPQSNAPNRQRASAVPRFGVWDERSAAAAAQGFTVQFERVKRDREAARARGVPRPPPPPPPEPRRSHRDSPFFSKMFGCFRPTDRY